MRHDRTRLRVPEVSRARGRPSVGYPIRPGKLRGMTKLCACRQAALTRRRETRETGRLAPRTAGAGLSAIAILQAGAFPQQHGSFTPLPSGERGWEERRERTGLAGVDGKPTSRAGGGKTRLSGVAAGAKGGDGGPFPDGGVVC